VLEVLTVNETFVRGRLCQTLRSSLTWQKQALYGEVSKPTRIGHSIRHKVHKLVPDGNSKFAIVGLGSTAKHKAAGREKCACTT
jgi:hypothetical protein